MYNYQNNNLNEIKDTNITILFWTVLHNHVCGKS